ncbi:MAG: HK97-gp10 family putative phage morphogenesis protein [Candidatus Moraniibacteriota bacterium]
MSDINFEIRGLDKLRTALKRAPALAIQEFGKAIQKSALTIQSNAIKEAPVNKATGGGNLRQNIRVTSMTKTRAVVTSKAPYSIFVEEGTSPHTIEVKNKRVLANKRTGQFFGKKVNHPGTRANPFMRRAVDKSKGLVESYFMTAMNKVLKSLT